MSDIHCDCRRVVGFVGPSLWFPLFPITMKNRIFRNKRKQSPDPSPQDTSPGILAGISARPVSHQAQSNIGLEGGRIRSYQDLEIDRADLTVALGEGSSGGPQIAFQDSMDEDQEPPASVAWTSGAMIGGIESRTNRTSECF